MLEELPDFDEMLKVAEQIKDLMIMRDDLERKIKQGEADVYKKAMTDKSRFENGKPPSVAFVKSLYEYTGLDGELLPLRESFARTKAQLVYLQAEYDLMKTRIDIYRTESANKRAAL